MELTTDTWPMVWQKIIPILGSMFSSELAKAKMPAILGPNTLAFRFPVQYNQAREHVQVADRVVRIEDALRRVTGKAWKVQIEVDSRATIKTEAVVAPKPKASPKEEAAMIPLIKRAMDMLGATIQRAEEGFGELPPPRTQRPSSPEES